MGSTSAHTASAASTAWAFVSATTTASGSPTKRTTSFASSGWATWPSSGLDMSGPTSMSSAVKTPTTPGMAAASAVSMDSMRPWAVKARTNATCRASVGAMLSM